jgi:solute carrier family 35 (UDP-xylose/UDP-N-acetylglucosamine transporter), member B4
MATGQLITLGQFIFVAFEGLFHHVQWPSASGCWWWPTFLPSLKPRAVPIQRWFILVVVFYIVSALNNIALGYNISMPLHIIFRSGGLIVNMFLGWLLLSKRYATFHPHCESRKQFTTYADGYSDIQLDR